MFTAVRKRRLAPREQLGGRSFGRFWRGIRLWKAWRGRSLGAAAFGTERAARRMKCWRGIKLWKAWRGRSLRASVYEPEDPVGVERTAAGEEDF